MSPTPPGRTPAPQGRTHRERRLGLLFFLANLLLASWFVDVWTTPNPVSRALPALTWHERGTLRINAYATMTGDKSRVGDHYYSDKAPLPTLALIPVQAVARPLGVGNGARRHVRRWPIHVWRPLGIEDGTESTFRRIVPLLFVGGLVFGALPFALTASLLFALLRRAGAGASAAPLAMLPLYGSFAFVYAGTFFGHVLAGALLVASVLALRRERPVVAGLLLGSAFLTEYTLGIALPLLLAQLLLRHRGGPRPWRPALRFALGFAPAGVFLLAYNQALTGSAWTTLNAYHAAQPFQELGQAYGFGWPSPSSLWGVTLSPSTGLLPFAPVLVLVLLVGLGDLRRTGVGPVLRDPVPVLAVANVLSIACFFTWWGGWSYGPRYLVPVAMLLLVEGTAYLVRRGFGARWILGLGGLGLLASWAAKATLLYMIPDATSPAGPAPPTGRGPFLDHLLPEIAAGRFNANQLGTMVLGLEPAVGALLFGPLFALLCTGLVVASRRLDARTNGAGSPPTIPA